MNEYDSVDQNHDWRDAMVSESSTSPCLPDQHGHPEDGESVAPNPIPKQPSFQTII